MTNQKLSMDDLGRMSAQAYQSAHKFDFAIVLDNIRSLNNVGSFFRTADALATSELHLCGITATPPNRDIEKTALGATETVKWTYWQQNDDLLTYLKTHNYQIVCVEQTQQSVKLQEVAFAKDQKYAFVLGNEVFGVDDFWVQQADFCIEIPQFGTKHSFNVAIAAGIISWEFVRQIIGN